MLEILKRNKIRGDYGITYDMDILRLIDELRGYGLLINSVVITRYSGQPATKVFINKLERRNIKVYKTLRNRRLSSQHRKNRLRRWFWKK
jgi:uncharacterized protein (UPF0371 family)